MSDTPQVDVIARPIGLNLVAPQTNPALELAHSLADTNEALGPVLQGYAKEQQTRLGLKAQSDALAQSGTAFGDAVRAGKIEPTQNPWYIQAYEQKAAQVRSQGQISQLASDSQTWAEKNDPQAFAQRWQKEVGTIAQGYQGIDQARGFKAAADPLTEQALNTNVEYNAQAIQQKNVQDTTALMSGALEDAFKKNPKGSPADYYATLEPFHQQWLGTGGTEAAYSDLVKGAFVGAGESMGNADFLDNLKTERVTGQGSIYNQANAHGDPNAAEIEQAKYRIDRDLSVRGMSGVHQAQAAQELEGYNFQAAAYAKFGWDLPAGRITQDQLQGFAKDNGFSPAGYQAFMQLEARDLASNNTYASAQTRQYALSPGNQDTILGLRTQALKAGWSAQLENAVMEQVRNGMDENTANDILTKADSSSKYFRSEARTEVHEARSEANMDRQARMQGSRDFKQSLAESIGQADAALQGAGSKYLLNPTFRTLAVRGATDMGNAWLRQHPDDYMGAQKAAEDYLDAKVVRPKIAAMKTAQAFRLQGGAGGNPFQAQSDAQKRQFDAAMAASKSK
jgi:hypothetical protein